MEIQPLASQSDSSTPSISGAAKPGATTRGSSRESAIRLLKQSHASTGSLLPQYLLAGVVTDVQGLAVLVQLLGPATQGAILAVRLAGTCAEPLEHLRAHRRRKEGGRERKRAIEEEGGKRAHCPFNRGIRDREGTPEPLKWMGVFFIFFFRAGGNQKN